MSAVEPARYDRARLAAVGARMLALRKSMFVQMAALTVLFLGWGIYAFVARPIMDLAPIGAVAPIDATAGAVQGILNDFISAHEQNRAAPDTLATDPTLRAVASRNPGFAYYVRVGDRTFGNAQPFFYHRNGFDRVERLRRALPNTNLCSQTGEPAGNPAGSAYFSFVMCDSVHYFEYRNLTHPVVTTSSHTVGMYQRWLWIFGSTFLLPAGGVFLIFALILFAHMRAIRRVATLAQSFDPRHSDRALPERGVASEIVPLVRAVNYMIARVTDHQRRNTFFLSAAAHEMRTPLTVLRTRLELMENGAVRDKLIADVGRLTSLVNQLLELMSIGNRREITGFVNLVACTRKVVRDLAVIAAERGVGLACRVEIEVFEIAGGEALVQSAIANLIDNAISFSPPGSQVEVAIDDAGAVSVRDHGPGLGDEIREALFDPFIRHPVTRQGYGLGLAIAKAIMVLHEGTIDAENANDGGAIFTVKFQPYA